MVQAQAQTKAKAKASPHHWLEATVITPEQREHMIAEAAYYIAAHRNFQGGDPGQDWLQAEAEIDRSLHGAVR